MSTRQFRILMFVLRSIALMIYWDLMIRSGRASARNMFHGFGDDKPFTNSEKNEEAYGCAFRHYKLIAEAVDSESTYERE